MLDDEEDEALLNYSLPPAPDLVAGDEVTNIHQEYFQSGDQVIRRLAFKVIRPFETR